MVANLPVEWYKQQEVVKKTKDKKKKIEELLKLISLTPKHKGTEKLLAFLRKRVAKLKEDIEKERKKKKAMKREPRIKKEGPQVCVVGLANSGKSYLINKLTGTNLKSSEIPFEQRDMEAGAIKYGKAIIQLVEIPSLKKKFHHTRKGNEFFNVIRNCDLLLITYSDEWEIREVLNELSEENISKEYILVKRGDIDFEALKREIWNKLDLICVYTKEPRGEIAEKPIVLKRGSTIRDLAEKVHKEFVEKFKFARVRRGNKKGLGILAGIDFVLEDGDIVEIHIKK